MAGAVWALVSGKVIPRWYYDEEQDRTEYWKKIAERAVNLNEKQQNVVHETQAVTKELVARRRRVA